MGSTLYYFAQYFCWTQLLQHELGYELFYSAAQKESFWESIINVSDELARFPYRPYFPADLLLPAALKSDRQVFRVQQRAIGELMVDQTNGANRILSYREFLDRWLDPADLKLKRHIEPLEQFLIDIVPKADLRWDRLEGMRRELVTFKRFSAARFWNLHKEARLFFQKVLKGIAGLSQNDADETFQKGILCNWWRRVQTITPEGIAEKLNERNLDWHLKHYDWPDPLDGDNPFCNNTPFISATAGVVERDEFGQRNMVFDPLITALQFATRDFTDVGHVFYSYLFTLGRQSIELLEFSEEVRELNIYKAFLPFHPEGEILAKIQIRAPQIEKWEEYDGSAALADLRSGRIPQPTRVRRNQGYASPERYCNIRGLVTD